MRLELTQNDPRAQAVLREVAKMSDWKRQRKGRALGLAFADYHGSLSAGVVEVSLQRASGKIKVHNMWLAVDPGLAVQPANVLAQLEGSAVFGLSVALLEELTIKNGSPVQTNFHEYPVLRMSEMPEIHTQIVASNAPPTGVGEIVLRASQAGDALFAAAADVTAKINVLAELNQIYLGTTLNSATRGDIALVFPAGSGAGTVLLAVPSAGLYGAYPVTLAANGTFELALSPGVSGSASDDGKVRAAASVTLRGAVRDGVLSAVIESLGLEFNALRVSATGPSAAVAGYYRAGLLGSAQGDRKSTRLNSSHT